VPIPVEHIRQDSEVEERARPSAARLIATVGLLLIGIGALVGRASVSDPPLTLCHTSEVIGNESLAQSVELDEQRCERADASRRDDAARARGVWTVVAGCALVAACALGVMSLRDRKRRLTSRGSGPAAH
jgi:hypothetical protein